MTISILIEDQAVPQLLTSAIEASEIEQKKSKYGKATSQLETYGLLWGYVLPERNGHPVRIVVTMVTVETSALAHQDWVAPNRESLEMKRDFFNKYWPHIELVGTFHSHPYAGLTEVNSNQGWRASPGDCEHWPQAHEDLFSDMPYLAHIIVTVTALEKKGWAYPSRLANAEAETGFVLTADYRKLWIKGYCTEQVFNEADDEGADDYYTYLLNKKIKLDIPSLEKRFE